ncbi:DUF3298 and DUF4163 domain-containing protein [Algibacter mikhailovii]|uniref:DUF3298 and DUF4163 domain-containing protein n=1 Tax=Algibacter mikhailovii TaxID=425498 RepID=UPI002494C74F|nr:DUF3298 and DUF4163 domain-containing protein [Algibacter mikhailovii]
MHLKTIVLLVGFTFFNLSCKEEKPAITFTENNYLLSNDNIVSINIPEAHGNAEITKKINTSLEAKIQAFLNTSQSNENSGKSINNSIDAFNNEFKDFKSSFPESQQIWEAQFDGEVLYQSNDIISIALTSYVNTGGAHGMLTVSFLNFNPNTGDILGNTELINDTQGFKKAALPFLLKSVENKDTDIKQNTEFPMPENMAYSTSGFILLYNPYEIAPYSSGLIECTIPYEYVAQYLVFNSL